MNINSCTDLHRAVNATAQREHLNTITARCHSSRTVSGTVDQQLAGLYVPRSGDQRKLRPLHAEILMDVEISGTVCKVTFDRCYGDPSQMGLRRVTLALHADPSYPYWAIISERFYPMPTGPITSRNACADLPAGHADATSAASERERLARRAQYLSADARYRSACDARERYHAAQAAARDLGDAYTAILGVVLALG